MVDATSRGMFSFVVTGTNSGNDKILVAAVSGKAPVITSLFMSAGAACSAIIETNEGTSVTKARLDLVGVGTAGGGGLYLEGPRGYRLHADVTITGSYAIWGSYFYK